MYSNYISFKRKFRCVSHGAPSRNFNINIWRYCIKFMYSIYTLYSTVYIHFRKSREKDHRSPAWSKSIIQVKGKCCLSGLALLVRLVFRAQCGWVGYMAKLSAPHIVTQSYPVQQWPQAMKGAKQHRRHLPFPLGYSYSFVSNVIQALGWPGYGTVQDRSQLGGTQNQNCRLGNYE